MLCCFVYTCSESRRVETNPRLLAAPSQFSTFTFRCSVFNYPFSLDILANSFALVESSTPFFSSDPELFAQTPGVWRYSRPFWLALSPVEGNSPLFTRRFARPQSPLKIPRLEEIQTAPGYNFTGTQMDHGNYQKLAMATQLPHRLGYPPKPGTRMAS
jgi:hypothetical protein